MEIRVPSLGPGAPDLPTNLLVYLHPIIYLCLFKPDYSTWSKLHLAQKLSTLLNRRKKKNEFEVYFHYENVFWSEDTVWTPAKGIYHSPLSIPSIKTKDRWIECSEMGFFGWHPILYWFDKVPSGMPHFIARSAHPWFPRRVNHECLNA